MVVSIKRNELLQADPSEQCLALRITVIKVLLTVTIFDICSTSLLIMCPHLINFHSSLPSHVNQPGTVTFLSVKETGSRNQTPASGWVLGPCHNESDWMEDAEQTTWGIAVYRAACAEKWSTAPHPTRSTHLALPYLQEYRWSQILHQVNRVPGIRIHCVMTMPCI